MSRTFKVRSLSTSGPGVTAGSHGHGAAGAFMAMSDQAGAVYDVNAKEIGLSEEEVAAQLKSGRIKTTDLVEEDGRWTTLADSMSFGDVARERSGGEAFSRNMPYMLMGLLSVALLFGYFMLKLLVRR
jgi:hypothetical protein